MRICSVCGTTLKPYTSWTVTAHEFKCWKSNPSQVPPEFQKEFERLLEGDRRSTAARKVWAERKARKREKREKGE